jgi:hypothetical protein
MSGIARRSILLATASAAIGACARPASSVSPSQPAPAPSAPKPSLLDRIGVGLYTVRDALKADPAATLRSIAALGYRSVETMLRPSIADAVRAAGLAQPSAYAPVYLATGNPEGMRQPLPPADLTWEESSQGRKRSSSSSQRTTARSVRQGRAANLAALERATPTSLRCVQLRARGSARVRRRAAGREASTAWRIVESKKR